MIRTAGIIILIIAAALAAVCTSTLSGGRDIAWDAIRAHFEYQDDWSFGLGCYIKVKGYAFNTGDMPVDGLRLNFNLVDTRTGTIRDSRKIYLGTLQAGQPLSFESDLNGECTPDYQVEGAVLR